MTLQEKLHASRVLSVVTATSVSSAVQLALSNVICCGGSWMATTDLVDNGRWDDIEALAREAMQEHS